MWLGVTGDLVVFRKRAHSKLVDYRIDWNGRH
jgi:hypothetical protein